MRKNIFLTFLIICLFKISLGQKEILNNSSIIQLHQIGLGSQTIINKIKTSKTNFDVSIAGLGNLKKASVSDEVIAEMIAVSDKQETAAAIASEDPNDPTSYHEPGIYYYDDKNHKMIQLEPALFSQSKSGSSAISSLTYGIASIKTKSSVSGAHASLQIKNSKPFFFFYFEKSNNSLSNSTYAWDASVTSPNEFIMIKFNITSKSREVITGEWNHWSGGETGIENKNKMEFSFEKVTKGIYKVTPKENLEPYEYGFIYAGGSEYSQSSKKVFDFGTE